MLKKWQDHSFVSYNEREVFSDNWSDQPDESDLIQKRKQIENTHEKYAQLLGNAYNAAYAIYPLLAHKCQPPGGLGGHAPKHS